MNVDKKNLRSLNCVSSATRLEKIATYLLAHMIFLKNQSVRTPIDTLIFGFYTLFRSSQKSRTQIIIKTKKL